MSTNPDHINQLAATIREVDGSHAKGAADLAQPKGQSSLNVNLIIDTSPENLKRLCDGLAAAVTPNGGYEAATIDDPAPGTGGDQMVQVQWWIPQHGCDSLENTLDAIKYRIGRAVEDWWATALVPAALAKPEGEGLTNDEALRRGRPATPPPLPSNYIDPEHQGEELELLQTFYRACQAEGGTADEIYLRGIRAVLAARPAAPPAPEPYNPTKDEVMDMAKSFQLEVNDQDALMWLVVTAIAAWGDASAAPPAPEPGGMARCLADSLSAFKITQDPAIYPASHWSRRAVNLLAQRPQWLAPPAPEMMEAVGNCARIELVVALYSLASQFENETASFTGDDATAVQGHIRHARKIAAKHNQNGPGCAPAVLPAPEMRKVMTPLTVGASCGGGARLSRDQCARAATLLQQQEARIAGLRSALADCGRAVGASISDECSDGFLLEVPTEVRLAVTNAAPAVAPADGRIADPLALARFEYRVTEPILPPDADSPVMNKRQMEDWLNDMDAQGWEFVSYGATYWHNKDIPQEWWVFRRPRQVDPIRMNESTDTLFKLKAAPAPAVVPVVVSEWDNGFMAGVCAALAVVKDHDDGTVWREIVRSVGTDHALNYAANVNPEDWELAGFSTYAQSELGKGKPDPLPQAGEVKP